MTPCVKERDPAAPERGRRGSWRRLAMSLAVALPLLVGLSAGAEDDLRESGTISISQVQVAFLWGGNVGGGTLNYGGKSYDFSIGGLGVGGIGASTIEATGTVYNLDKLEDFPGAYGQARLGFAAGDQSSGSMWLQNESGVYIEVEAKREGVMLSGGVDAIYIEFD
jgi:hypothetical protein